MGYMLKNGRQYRTDIQPIHKQFTVSQILSIKSQRVMQAIRKAVA